jgi:uncharacterized protein (UPF0276 family)
MVDHPAGAAAAAAAVEINKMTDRIGLGWRPELAAGILSNLDRIDVLEAIADDYFDSQARVRALKTLAAQTSVVLHGIALGMASTAPVDPKRLAKMAKLIEQIRPESWSEHLAFVRAGKIEIGHLAAPPRTQSTIDATAENLETARKIVGSLPLVENIATLIDPPASSLAEPEWLTETVQASGAGLLLDLHNLYANSINFAVDPRDFLARLPLDQVHTVHISGGRFIGRILDDHLHDPPDPIYDLLTELAEKCPNPLTVILERDGSYPPMEHLLAQLDRAREAMAKGRHERSEAGKISSVAVC